MEGRSLWVVRSRAAAVVVVFGYAFLLVVAQVNARMMRGRAERLLAEMRALTVGKSTYADVVAIQGRWKRWGASDGECSAQKCVYRVGLDEAHGLPGLRTMDMLGHGHGALAILDIEVADGLVQEVTYQIWLDVPRGYGSRWEREDPQPAGYVPYSSGSYTLIGQVKSASTLKPLCCYWPYSQPHPDYVATKPSECEGCLAIWGEFEPEASSDAKRRMASFNFDCITRWTPCADEVDIMPEAAQEYRRAQREMERRDAELERCSVPVWDLAVASLNAAVIRLEDDPGAPYKVKAVAMKPLGGNAEWAPDTTRVLTDLPESSAVMDYELPQRHPVIALYMDDDDGFVLYPCGLIPDTAENEATVSAAVAVGQGRALD